MQSFSFHSLYSRLLALLLLCPLTLAQAQIYLGYCNDEVGNSGVTNSTSGATISCAIALTPSQWDDYSFCDLTGIRFGLYTSHDVSQIKVWIRESLRGEDLVATTLDSTQFQSGWNDVTLASPLSFEGHDTLYIGYDYTQLKSKLKVIAASGPKKTAGSFWVGVNNKWNDQNSKYPPLCIRAILSSRYGHAASMSGLRLDRRSIFDYQQDSLTVTGSIRNLGSQPLTSFELTYADSTFATRTLHYDLPELGFGQSTSFQFSFVPQAQCLYPDIPLTIHLGQPNGQDNEYQQQDVTLFYERGRQDLTCNNPVLVEEFTSLDNGYAALGAQRLRESIEEAHRLNLGDLYEHRDEVDGYSTHYILLSRHQGYGPADALCVTGGSDYQPEWFGPDRLTFAPAVWVNRQGLPMSTTLPVDSLARYLSESSVKQHLTNELDSITYDPDTRTLTAVVNTFIHCMGQMRDPRIMCVLVQDYNMMYPQKDYFGLEEVQQQNVVRSYLSPSSQQLLSWTNRDEVMAGQTRLTDQGATYDPDNNLYTIKHRFSCQITDEFGPLSSLSLVTYVYDAAGEGTVNGVNIKKIE